MYLPKPAAHEARHAGHGWNGMLKVFPKYLALSTSSARQFAVTGILRFLFHGLSSSTNLTPRPPSFALAPVSGYRSSISCFGVGRHQPLAGAERRNFQHVKPGERLRPMPPVPVAQLLSIEPAILRCVITTFRKAQPNFVHDLHKRKWHNAEQTGPGESVLSRSNISVRCVMPSQPVT